MSNAYANSWVVYMYRNPSINGQNIDRLLAEDIFCDTFIEDKCIAAFGENLFYTDDNHLSIEGTSLLAERILHILEKE